MSKSTMYLRLLQAAYVILLLIVWASPEMRSQNIDMLRVIRPIHFGLALILFLLIYGVGEYVTKQISVFNWKPLSSNASVISIFNTRIGKIVFIPLVFTLPIVSHFEELVFRGLPKSIAAIIASNIIFGLVHLTVGARLGVCVAVSMGGFWLSFVFSRYGIDGATATHAVYNMVLTSIVGFTVFTSEKGEIKVH